MNGKLLLYIDQWNTTYCSRTVKNLREQVGGGKISKMYRDTPDGVMHIGYVIGSQWLRFYEPYNIPA